MQSRFSSIGRFLDSQIAKTLGVRTAKQQSRQRMLFLISAEYFTGIFPRGEVHFSFEGIAEIALR